MAVEALRLKAKQMEMKAAELGLQFSTLMREGKREEAWKRLTDAEVFRTQIDGVDLLRIEVENRLKEFGGDITFEEFHALREDRQQTEHRRIPHEEEQQSAGGPPTPPTTTALPPAPTKAGEIFMGEVENARSGKVEEARSEQQKRNRKKQCIVDVPVSDNKIIQIPEKYQSVVTACVILYQEQTSVGIDELYELTYGNLPKDQKDRNKLVTDLRHVKPVLQKVGLRIEQPIGSAERGKGKKAIYSVKDIEPVTQEEQEKQNKAKKLKESYDKFELQVNESVVIPIRGKINYEAAVRVVNESQTGQGAVKEDLYYALYDPERKTAYTRKERRKTDNVIHTIRGIFSAYNLHLNRPSNLNERLRNDESILYIKELLPTVEPGRKESSTDEEEALITHEDLAIIKVWIKSKSGIKIVVGKNRDFTFQIPPEAREVFDKVPEVEIGGNLTIKRREAVKNLQRIIGQYATNPSYMYPDTIVHEFVTAARDLDEHAMFGFLPELLEGKIREREVTEHLTKARFERYTTPRTEYSWIAPAAMITKIEEREKEKAKNDSL